MIPKGWVYPVGNLIVGTALRLLATFRVERVGAVPPQGKLLVVSNHTGLIDPALLSLSVPRRLRFLAKEEAFGNALAGWILRAYGAFPVARNRRDIQGLRWARSILERDEVIALFPEGTRSPRGLRKPVPGVVHLHLRTQAPMLPVAITGTQHITTIPRIFLPTGHITVRVGEPFALPVTEARVEKGDVPALADMIMRRIADLLPEEQRGVYATRESASSAIERPG